MRIKFLFILLALGLLLFGGFLIYFSTLIGWVYFYIAEAFVLSILCYLLFFYRKIVKPMNSVSVGMELLREQDFSSRLSLVGQYEADRIVTIFNRMMEQLKNERLRLREQNMFLDLLIKASPMGVLILSFDEEVSEINPMGEKLLGVLQEESLGKKLADLNSPLATELSTIPNNRTATIRLNDSKIYKCTRSSFVDHGFQHPFFLIESLTEEVMKAEKKAYGKVIRMIAHEVNNTTAGITSTLDSVEELLAVEKGMTDVCEVMRVCHDRCHSMSQFITRFADVVKIPEPNLSQISLNELVMTCKRFMESICADRHIVLLLQLDESMEGVKIDVSLLEQVLVNIIKNAVESIGQDGHIVIRTISPNVLEIIDDGEGLSKEVELKLFTPFFSTKPNGQGIGLLFIREVLMLHGCTFSLKTDDEGLTRFRILFPVNSSMNR